MDSTAGPEDMSSTSGTNDTTSTGAAAGESGAESSEDESGGEGDPGPVFVPPPPCGPDAECQDGTPGCHQCVRDRVVFVTQAELAPDEIKGLYSADSLCKQYADDARLARPSAFVAWLSDTSHDARDRVTLVEGRYFRTDGVLVASGRQAWLTGDLVAPIDHDEYGDPIDAGVWTGTAADGTALPGSTHCQDWTSSAYVEGGYYGSCGSIDGSWTYVPDDVVNPMTCATAFHLYCIEGT